MFKDSKNGIIDYEDFLRYRASTASLSSDRSGSNSIDTNSNSMSPRYQQQQQQLLSSSPNSVGKHPPKSPTVKLHYDEGNLNHHKVSKTSPNGSDDNNKSNNTRNQFDYLNNSNISSTSQLTAATGTGTGTIPSTEERLQNLVKRIEYSRSPQGLAGIKPSSASAGANTSANTNINTSDRQKSSSTPSGNSSPGPGQGPSPKDQYLETYPSNNNNKISMTENSPTYMKMNRTMNNMHDVTNNNVNGWINNTNTNNRDSTTTTTTNNNNKTNNNNSNSVVSKSMSSLEMMQQGGVVKARHDLFDQTTTGGNNNRDKRDNSFLD